MVGYWYSAAFPGLRVSGASDGHGLALGWVHVVSELITQGKLQRVGTGTSRREPFGILSPATTPDPTVGVDRLAGRARVGPGGMWASAVSAA